MKYKTSTLDIDWQREGSKFIKGRYIWTCASLPDDGRGAGVQHRWDRKPQGQALLYSSLPFPFLDEVLPFLLGSAGELLGPFG